MRDAGPAFAVKAAASSAVDSITAEISGSEVDSSLANPAGRQDLNFENSAATIPAPRNAPERAEDVASLLAEFVPEKSASARGRKDTRMPGNAEPETGRMESGEQAGDRNRNATPGGTVNLPPGMAPIEKSSTPAPAASVVVPRPAAAHRISLQSLLNESAGSLRVENSTPQPTPTAPRSEIAFQAEILLSNRQPAAEASLANVAPEPAVRLRSHAAGPDGAPHSTAGPVQQTEAKITARPAELAPAAIIAAEEHAGTSAVQPSQEHASTHPDRGMHQTPSFAPANWMAPRAGSEPAPATRTAAVPSAAQLDFAAPAETGHAARSVALNFQSEDHGSANVILTDRGGQVHVTVRSSDPALTQSLRSDLSTLAGGLQQHGFDFKLWSPSSSGPAGAEARVHSNDMSDPGDFHGQTSDRQPPDDNNPRHRRQNEWSEELD
jgi:hypothetical protein